MELRFKYCLCFLAAFLELCIAVAIGYAAGMEWPVTASALTVLELLPLFVFCRLLPIEFGPSGLTRSQLKLHLVIFAVLGTVFGLPFGFLYQITDDPSEQAVIGTVCIVVAGLCMAFWSGRPLYLCGALSTLPRGFQGSLLPNHETTPVHIPWYGWILSIYFFCTSFARYKKDQSTLGMLTVAVAMCIPYGHALVKRPSEALSFFVMMGVFAYAQILWMRRGRRFPPGLAGCKFITLEYIRRAAASGEGIKRCQDLPPDAFGDPSKARFVISVSHRWLEHYTCDLKSESFPEGMRLHTMMAALDEYFSVRGIVQGTGFTNRLQRLAMALTGGRDVVLFFDFMSLPQESIAADGSIQTRSPHEQLLFSRCLPNMGALYSMLPVLVCEDVPEGVWPYQDSGWCFAEVSTAWLGNQLQTYSAHCQAARWLRDIFSRYDDPALFAEALDQELNKKHFMRAQDREEVRNIIRGFHLKSRLVSALKRKSSTDLADVLATSSARALGLLDQAVDSDLNTPLHLAVARNFPNGVKQLLESGARRDLRNLRGDLAVDCFMIPRLSRAAFTCRKYVLLKNIKGGLGTVRKFSQRSSSTSNGTSVDTHAVVAGDIVIGIDKDATPTTQSYQLNGTNGTHSQFWSSSASFCVSQPPPMDADLEQPNSTSSVVVANFGSSTSLSLQDASPAEPAQPLDTAATATWNPSSARAQTALDSGAEAAESPTWQPWQTWNDSDSGAGSIEDPTDGGSPTLTPTTRSSRDGVPSGKVLPLKDSI